MSVSKSKLEISRLPLFDGIMATRFDEMVIASRNSVMNFKPTWGISTLRYTTSLTGTGSNATSENGEFKLSSGTSLNGLSFVRTTERGQYKAGTMGEIGIGIRVPTNPTGTQFVEWGYTDFVNSGFYFGIDSNGYYIVRLSNGIITEKIYQSDWNTDKVDGTGKSGLTLNYQNGVVTQIEFVWYGYGDIDFVVYPFNPKTGHIQKVIIHQIKENDQVSIIDPNQPISFRVGNGASSNTNLDMYVGGQQFSVISGNYIVRRRFVSDYLENYTTQQNTDWQPIIAFRKKSTFNGRPNSINVSNTGFSVAADGELLTRLTIGGVTDGTSVYSTPLDFSASETACEVRKVSAVNTLTGVSTGLPKKYDYVSSTNKSNAKVEQESEIFIGDNQEIILWIKRYTANGSIVIKFGMIEWQEEW